jgi:hypothetical protein
MNKVGFAGVMLLACVVGLLADDAPKKEVPMSQAAETQILKAEVAHDKAVKAQMEAQGGLQELQIEAQRLSERLSKAKADADNDEKNSQKLLDAAIEASWKESGLSKDQYEADTAGFKFLLKAKAPAAAPAATAPTKK